MVSNANGKHWGNIVGRRWWRWGINAEWSISGTAALK